ncbi:MAG TPA: VCBS repeat-containing protein, partial [Chitinophagaceae bacterium]|nr:VCBS repeat-containing protein [Chitinophagaceae bacterium]
MFTQLSSSTTNIHFVNNPTEGDSLNILDYLYYYNGAGVAVGDINNDGLPDIYFTANNKGGNKLYLNKGNFSFEDITKKAGVQGDADWCTGVTMADVNGDGLLDIYVCAVAGKLGLKGHNELFINKGNLTFTDSSAAYGLNFSGYSTQAAFFDYDHDGDLDCILLNQSMHSSETAGDTSLRHKFSPLSGGRLYRNELHPAKGIASSTIKFTDVTKGSGIYNSAICYGLGLAVSDLNNDGWDDIYVGNDFHENDYYYINNHDGTFTESGAKHFNHYSRFSMGNDIADYNNDGQPDIITVDMLPADEKTVKTYNSDEHIDMYNYKVVQNGFQPQFSRNCLQQNLGNGKAFSDVGLMDGIAATDWSWCPLFADFDNDGVKDLFISNGIPHRMMDEDYIKFISSMQVQRAINQTKQYDKT